MYMNVNMYIKVQQHTQTTLFGMKKDCFSHHKDTLIEHTRNY